MNAIENGDPDDVFEYLRTKCYDPDINIRIASFVLLNIRSGEIDDRQSFLGDEAMLLLNMHEADLKTVLG